MQVIKQKKHLPKTTKKTAFIPTMGALHDGHLALIKEAKKHADFIIVSIFVNKTQFNDAKDYENYPRDNENDLKKLEKSGVDVVFLPSHHEIYPENEQNPILPPTNLANCLCGATRPGHFDGVRLVIAKLFAAIDPDFAIFGKKDYQQYRIITELTAQLGLKTKIIGLDTVRESDGLAMSSRNRLLNEKQRKSATKIYQILTKIKNNVKNTSNLENLLQNSISELKKVGFEEVSYLQIRGEQRLELITEYKNQQDLRIFIAATIGKIRLIDNLKI